MVDQVSTIELTDEHWRSLASRADLPCDERDYFAASGVSGPVGETRRQYTRMQMRELGVVLRRGQEHGVYVRDVSPKGVGIYSPVQLFPDERISLLMNDRGWFDLTLRRCRRVDHRCYDCGMVFADGAIPPWVYKRLIRSHSRRE